MTFDDRVRALEPLGFTPRQTRFLVTVALHGGYCLRRHYQEFAGIQYGKAVRAFFGELVVRRLAMEIVYRRDRGYLYHVHAWSIYRSLQQDDNRNRRKASPALIARKLMVLDYVLSIPGVEWLATEDDKVAAFKDRYGVPAECLPRRIYEAAGDGRTTRYFVHKLPIAVMDDGGTVLFVHLVVDGSGHAFGQFLADHALLFDHLPAWRVAAVCPPHLRGLVVCEGVFRDFLASRRSPSTNDPAELSWYFATRQKVESQQFSRLPIAEINRFRDARRRFGASVEALYGRWIQDGDAALNGQRLPALSTRRGREPELVMQLLPRKYEQFGSLAGVS